jgi:FkbM family methyltransferase
VLLDQRTREGHRAAGGGGPLAATTGLLGRTWRRLRGFPRQGVEVDIAALFLGTPYGGYAVAAELLSPESIVYSFGLGEDVSFDLALIERFGCVVHGFDPTPRSLSWLGAQALPNALVIHPYGLAGFDGVASFAAPQNPSHVSHSVLARRSAARIDLPVKRLRTIGRELGHERIDLLKMDIEGAEYAAIEDLLSEGALPRQILLEFHHGRMGVTRGDTERAIDRLRERNYRVFHVRPTGREFSFLLCA